MAKKVNLSGSGSGGGGRKRYGISDTINFGKYKGDTIEKVLEKDPKYLLWAVEHIEWFELNDDVLEAIDDAQHLPEDTYKRFKRF